MSEKLLMGIVTLLLTAAGSLGFVKYWIEPIFEEDRTRRKYATALWLACEELRLHLEELQRSLAPTNGGASDETTRDALKKIPRHDHKGQIDWFTKTGYLTMITAYRISVVSAWLRLYQREMLFSSGRKNQAFLEGLYIRAQGLRTAFSSRTCLWYYYFDAIGDRLIERSDGKTPMTFSFLHLNATEEDFRLFFEQLHMFIWFVANKDPNHNYRDNLPLILDELKGMGSFLDSNNLLSGLQFTQRPIEQEQLGRVQREMQQKVSE